MHRNSSDRTFSAVPVQGCGVAKRDTRSPETDALLRAARAGNADSVRPLLASPNVDINGIDEHGNTPLIQAAPSDTMRLLYQRGAIYSPRRTGRSVCHQCE